MNVIKPPKGRSYLPWDHPPHQTMRFPSFWSLLGVPSGPGRTPGEQRVRDQHIALEITRLRSLGEPAEAVKTAVAEAFGVSKRTCEYAWKEHRDKARQWLPAYASLLANLPQSNPPPITSDTSRK